MISYVIHFVSSYWQYTIQTDVRICALYIISCMRVFALWFIFVYVWIGFSLECILLNKQYVGLLMHSSVVLMSSAHIDHRLLHTLEFVSWICQFYFDFYAFHIISFTDNLFTFHSLFHKSTKCWKINRHKSGWLCSKKQIFCENLTMVSQENDWHCIWSSHFQNKEQTTWHFGCSIKTFESAQKKTLHKQEYVDVETKLYEWFLTQRQHNCTVSRPMCDMVKTYITKEKKTI